MIFVAKNRYKKVILFRMIPSKIVLRDSQKKRYSFVEISHLMFYGSAPIYGGN